MGDAAFRPQKGGSYGGEDLCRKRESLQKGGTVRNVAEHKGKGRLRSRGASVLEGICKSARIGRGQVGVEEGKLFSSG